MYRVGEFEKVSFEQFYEAMKDKFGSYTDDEIRACYDAIELPTRATSGSAGYDFRSPVTVLVRPGESKTIPTGIRVKLSHGWFLGCFPRSSLGFRYRMQLNNTVGIIDSDYYYSDNEGHIFVKFTNDSKGKDVDSFVIDAGDKFVQGVFLNYGLTLSDSTSETRNGGMGSTGR